MCPVCGGKATGKVGVERFYCWDCCVEYRIGSDGIQIFRLSEDGCLIALDSQEIYIKEL